MNPPAPDAPFSLQGLVWMRLGERNLGGPRRIELLAQIAACGSITQAAKAVKLSYKAAWDAIDSMNNLAGEPLVERVAGGKGGGGTRLTPRGELLVANFRRIQAEHQRFIEHLSRQSGALADDFLLIRSMGMKTSARNQFLGRISRIQRGAVNDEVALELANGMELVAVLTHESVENLGLQVGSEAFALVKASSVILLAGDGDQGARYSARNCLPGTVQRLSAGAVNTEVVLDLGAGASIAAVITNQSCTDLGLAPGQPARALFKASSVIVGVAG